MKKVTVQRDSPFASFLATRDRTYVFEAVLTDLPNESYMLLVLLPDFLKDFVCFAFWSFNSDALAVPAKVRNANKKTAHGHIRNRNSVLQMNSQAFIRKEKFFTSK